MNNEKFNFFLKKIEQRFPNKMKLNQGEMLLCINMSRSTFSRILEMNNLHKIPNISKKIEYKRTSCKYFTYEFNIFDIAKFLSEV